MGFVQSLYDASLLIKRYYNGDYIKIIIHTNDALYFGPNDEIEREFVDALSKRFNLEDQAYALVPLSSHISREGWIIPHGPRTVYKTFTKEILPRRCTMGSSTF